MHVSGIAVTNRNFPFRLPTRCVVGLGTPSIPAADSGKAARLLAESRGFVKSRSTSTILCSPYHTVTLAQAASYSIFNYSEQVRIDMATLEVCRRMLRLALVEALRIKANQPVADRGKVSRARDFSIRC